MTERTIETEADRHKMIVYIGGQKLPFTIKVTDGRVRSIEQNKLLWMWASEVAMQRSGMTVLEIQEEWKLLFGVPIMCADSDIFAAVWGRAQARLTHEEQLDMMKFMPVTSLMSVKQLKRYLDEVEAYNLSQGFDTTDTEERRSGTIRSRVVGRDTRHSDPSARKAPHRAAPKEKMR